MKKRILKYLFIAVGTIAGTMIGQAHGADLDKDASLSIEVGCIKEVHVGANK